MREGKTTRQCDIVVKQTLQDAENKNPTMHITCSNKGEQKLYKLQNRKSLDANDIDEASQQKKRKKAIAPNQTHTHTHTQNLCEKKQTSNAETKRQTKKSKFYNL
jgi:hypothetical protein